MKAKDKKGISLIVLVITIIIMIILAAAIILSLTNSGIIGNAKEAVKSSDLATIKNAKAIIDSEIEIAKSKGQDPLIGTTYDKYIKDKLEDQGIDTSEYYFTETGIVPIPEGFTLSSIEGEKEISTGLVIYEGTEPVTTESHSTALTTRNQFVWVPVEDIKKFKQTATYDGTITNPNSLYKEPATEVFITGTTGEKTTLSLTNDLTGEYKEYAAMRASVEKNKGFYIGRYETGRENIGGIDTPVSKKEQPVWTGIKWGESMSDVGTQGAVYRSREMYKHSTFVVSTLCYGVQWDAALQYISKTDPVYATNSAGKGNHAGSLKKTGYYAVNNIYDMAGNTWELTMESKSTSERINRGGNYGLNGAGTPASYRRASSPAVTYGDLGFRVALYIK